MKAIVEIVILYTEKLQQASAFARHTKEESKWMKQKEEAETHLLRGELYLTGSALSECREKP